MKISGISTNNQNLIAVQKILTPSQKSGGGVMSFKNIGRRNKSTSSIN